MKTLSTTVATAFLVCQCYGSPISAVIGSSSPTATVRNGTLQGIHSAEYDQDFFLGIPFAQAPVGNLRFRQPVSLNTTFNGTRDATAYSPACVGYGSDQWGYPISEDCLYLNVIRPLGYEGESLPVAFWIHGGGFAEGSSIDKRYNLSFIVENSVKIGKPIIGVSTNYRLSGWGFLNSDEVMGQGLANMGLHDQRLALHWVQENIEGFGGDPEKVTIWGESAGAGSVGLHLTAYGGRDDKLFRAAIMESGNPIYFRAQQGTQATQQQFNALVNQTNCGQSWDTIQCLRELPFETLNPLLNQSARAWANPVIDGDLVRNYGSVQLAEGRFVKVPIIDGANSDEGTGFSPRNVDNTSVIEAALPSWSTSFREEFLAVYPDDPSVNVVASMGLTRPGPPYGTQFRRSATMYGDMYFIAPRRQTVETWAAAGVDTYSYRFNAIPAGFPQEIGVTHFQEVAFVFYSILGEGYGIYPEVSTKPFQGKPQSYINLAYLMSCSWVSFVHDLDPNGWKGRPEDVPNWPLYSVSDPQNIVFDANVTSHPEPDTFRKEGINLINDNALGIFKR